MDFFSFFKKKDNTASKNVAKDRLKLVLVHDRVNCSSQVLEMLKTDIIKVISNYMEIDEEELDIQITQTQSDDKTGTVPVLYANIPIKIASQCFKDSISSQEELMKWCVQQGYSYNIDLDIVGKTDSDKSNLCNRVNDLSLYKRIIEIKDKLDPSFVGKLYTGNCPDYHICNVGTSVLSISSTGDIYPCVGFTSYKLGNINESSLLDIWENSPSLNELRSLRLKDFPICSECEDKDYCNVCMQYNASITGDIFTPDKRKCMITHMLKDYAKNKSI